MRDILIVLGMCVAAMTVGLALYLYGPKEFREVPLLGDKSAGASALGSDRPQEVGVRVLAEGTTAADATERKNYAVMSEERFALLWEKAYGPDAPALPEVDFDTEYVIGVFAGTKPAGGYGIRVDRVTDENASRTVAITVTSPGSGCMSTQALTSPFQFVALPITERDHVRSDAEETVACR